MKKNIQKLLIGKTLWMFCLFFIVISIYATTAESLEIYSFYTKKCSRIIGVLIHVNEEKAVILDIYGNSKVVNRQSINLIARYHTHENPFKKILFYSPGPIRVSSLASKNEVIVYPIKFYENLSLFLDTAGKIHVIENNDIVAIHRESKKNRVDSKSLSFVSIEAVHPSEKSICAKSPVRSSKIKRSSIKVLPIQTISGRFHIESFFSQYQKGYQMIESLKERTNFYALPLLFDDKSRLGLLYTRNDYKKWSSQSEAILPLYLEFGGGQIYRTQGSTKIGGASWRSLPFLRPVTAIRSEFKSHAIRGVFMGNLSGIAAKIMIGR